MSVTTIAGSPQRTCTIPNCGRPYDALGFCHTHYSRFKRSGEPQPEVPIGAKQDTSWLDDLQWLLDGGETPERVAERIGMPTASIARTLYRHRHPAAHLFGRLAMRERRSKVTP